MEIVLFHIYPRDDIDGAAYESAFNHMLELVSGVPGFIGIEGFSGEDGSELAVAQFETAEAIATWREQPEHVRTRDRGRKDFFASYEITIATTWKRYAWSAAEGKIRVIEDMTPQASTR